MDIHFRSFLINKVSARVDPRVQDLGKIVRDSIIFTEELQSIVGRLSGRDKRSIVIAVVTGHVKLPFPLYWFQSFVIGLMVDDIINQKEV